MKSDVRAFLFDLAPLNCPIAQATLTGMKLVTFQTHGTAPRTGISVANRDGTFIVDLKAALPPTDVTSPFSGQMLDIIQHAQVALPAIRKIEAKALAGQLPQAALHEESKVHLLSPIPNPPSMRDGYAFRQHVEAARRNRGLDMIPEFDQIPIFYFTNHLAVSGSGPIPVLPKHLDKLDFELEIAIVMGKEGRNIPANKADDYIFGYTIMNDWSARGLQMEEMKLNLGPAKGKDFSTSLGPYLVPKEDLESFSLPSAHGRRHDLRMKAFVNGKQVSDGNAKDMSWTFAQIIERASYGVTLRPGEVIGSGTVGTGCFLELNGTHKTNQWLQIGDEVVMEVAELGRLVNTIAEEK